MPVGHAAYSGSIVWNNFAATGTPQSEFSTSPVVTTAKNRKILTTSQSKSSQEIDESGMIPARRS